jgi:hypothetical protein
MTGDRENVRVRRNFVGDADGFDYRYYQEYNYYKRLFFGWLWRNRMDNEKAWDYAIGLIKIDGLEPTPEFMKMVEKEKRGEMTMDDIERELGKRYKMKGNVITGNIVPA